MRCSSPWWCDQLGFGCSLSLRSFVRFLDVSVSRAMGCFIGCFRVRDGDDRRRHRRPGPVNSRDAMLSQNRLSALFLAQGDDESPSKYEGNANLGSPQINRELREEAKFLKACGTITETPAEIRKASRKFKASPIHTSIGKHHLDQHPDEPHTPTKISEEWKQGTVSFEHTPSSCISSVQNTGVFSISSVEDSGAGSSVCMGVNGNADETDDVMDPGSTCLLGRKDQCKNKSVRFECDFDVSSPKSISEGARQNSKDSGSPSYHNASKNSPSLTPLKLSEEMQTPGTDFATNIEDVATGKTRIRSQYVHSVSNPVENVSQWEGLKEEDSSSHTMPSEQMESVEHSANVTPKSKVGVEETPARKEMMLNASLSSWLKPVNSTKDPNIENIRAVSRRNTQFGRTPGDRPIIGMVAAHWNEDDNSHVSPKWWDGNGIPNSTNKYKEDQKVSWHATPFEERLEKALSQESALPQRNLISGTPITFDDNEESDTALSQFQSSTHANSVVSC